MNHDHKHNHCKHERLKYCAHCDKPYCLDCTKEWNLNEPKWHWYNNTFPQITYTGTGTMTSGLAGGSIARGVSSAFSVPQQTQMNCKHNG